MRIMQAAQTNPFKETNFSSYLVSIKLFVDLLLQYQEQLSQLENKLVALAKEVEEFKIIQSIPGIGGKIAATILSEIGEVDRFNRAKKLVAFAGADPTLVHSLDGDLISLTLRGQSLFTYDSFSV